ncbi:alpha/beta-hydrolase [Xylariaceae sp. FL0594]|nr:alpha/beta-hydrolase [Xylariaceae sp. FL0594]
MSNVLIAWLFAFLFAGQPLARRDGAPRCRDMHFTFSTAAPNRVAKNPPEDLYSDVEVINAFLQQPVSYVTVSGRFTLFGQLCSPNSKAEPGWQWQWQWQWHERHEHENKDEPKLQLLVHGSTYNHTYWSSLREPSKPDFEWNGTDADPDLDELPGQEEGEGDLSLSWVHAATGRGYHTLAIDRLGQGGSSRPDPVGVVQDLLQTQLLHLLARRIRDEDVLGLGFRPALAGDVDRVSEYGGGEVDKGEEIQKERGRGRGKLIYVGHSFGSGLGVHLSSSHPDDVDAMLLTGIAVLRPGANPQPGSNLARWAPAAEAFPDRFPRDLQRAYLVSTNKTGRKGLYWSVEGEEFSSEMFERDWRGQGTNPLGEVLTVAEYLTSLPADPRLRLFDRPVLVSDGDADAIVCSDLGSRDLGPVKCGDGARDEIAATRAWFPAAVEKGLFETYRQPRAAHDHLLHKTGYLLIERAHEWLEGLGL